jgi:hypothetical protein
MNNTHLRIFTVVGLLNRFIVTSVKALGHFPGGVIRIEFFMQLCIKSYGYIYIYICTRLCMFVFMRT